VFDEFSEEELLSFVFEDEVLEFFGLFELSLFEELEDDELLEDELDEEDDEEDDVEVEVVVVDEPVEVEVDG
jgi:hypothetical protein